MSRSNRCLTAGVRNIHSSAQLRYATSNNAPVRSKPEPGGSTAVDSRPSAASLGKRSRCLKARNIKAAHAKLQPSTAPRSVCSNSCEAKEQEEVIATTLA
eukprot:3986424-Amphidinium_carterae.1